jgi:CubicO group peptidase (beta-lactamase class C family)
MTSILDHSANTSRVGARGAARSGAVATVLALGLVPAAALGVGQAHDAPRAVTARAAPDRTELEEALRAARARGRVPAVAGGVASGHRSPSVASVGVRRRGGPARVDRQDRFHLASLTKTVTATGVARLVERGLIDWASTPGQVLPHLAESMDPTLRDVTLRQLLTHRAGVAKFTTLPDFDALPDWQGTPERRRRAFTRWLLRRRPATPVGKYSYSNAGYTIAARMATEVSGHPWRRLVRSQVFRPLGVRTWFGWPADRPGQPWGHWLVRGRLRPAAPDAYRFPDLVAPAGDIAVRPRGFVRFLQVHLRGLRGRDTRLLRASTIRFMHRPVGSYAMGWVRRRTNGVMTSLHDGTAGTFSALAAIQPGRRLAAATFANAGGRRGSTAVGVSLGALLADPVSSGRSRR